MVGMCIAHQILERKVAKSIAIVEKESKIGLHSSGRNTGVLHAGLYYKPGSLKAKVCVDGARRLRDWVKDRNLPLNICGKVIVPPRPDLDEQLDVLADRGRANGATVEFWDEKQLRVLIPEARSASGRALFNELLHRWLLSGGADPRSDHTAYRRRGHPAQVRPSARQREWHRQQLEQQLEQQQLRFERATRAGHHHHKRQPALVPARR